MTPTERLTELHTELLRQIPTVEAHDDVLADELRDYADTIAACATRPTAHAAGEVARERMIGRLAHAIAAAALDRSADTVRDLLHTPIRDLDLVAVAKAATTSAVRTSALLAALDIANEAGLAALELLTDRASAPASEVAS